MTAVSAGDHARAARGLQSRSARAVVAPRTARRARQPPSRSIAAARGPGPGRALDQAPDSATQVVAQPRHGGELHAVGLLVQAHPEPEVGGSTSSSRSAWTMFGSDEQQPSARAGAP